MEGKMNNYDRYMLLLKAQEQTVAPVASDYTKEEEKVNYTDYDNYILGELRRTTPSGTPVMTEQQYYSDRNGKGSVAAVRSASNGKKNSLTKKGKILLALYVIIMVALASILIVCNTTKLPERDSVAGAADREIISGTQIRPMSIDEDEPTENNWFDKLCDALNK